MFVSLAAGFHRSGVFALQSHLFYPVELYFGRRRIVSIERLPVVRRFSTRTSPFSMIAGFAPIGLVS
jgi:hypothetical protein